MKIYLNWKSTHGTETLTELDTNEFPTHREFKAEKVRLQREYCTSGCYGCYWSQRACKDWGSN